jgi:hypothetical protein
MTARFSLDTPCQLHIITQIQTPEQNNTSAVAAARHPELPCAINSIWNIQTVRPLLLFNCGNLNTVTGLQDGTARKLSSISDRGKRLLYCQKHANRNLNPQTSTQLVPGIKRPGREPDNHQRHNINMKDEPDCNSCYCTYCCCCYEQLCYHSLSVRRMSGTAVH